MQEYFKGFLGYPTLSNFIKGSGLQAGCCCVQFHSPQQEAMMHILYCPHFVRFRFSQMPAKLHLSSLTYWFHLSMLRFLTGTVTTNQLFRGTHLQQAGLCSCNFRKDGPVQSTGLCLKDLEKGRAESQKSLEHFYKHHTCWQQQTPLLTGDICLTGIKVFFKSQQTSRGGRQKRRNVGKPPLKLCFRVNLRCAVAVCSLWHKDYCRLLPICSQSLQCLSPWHC